MVIIAVVLIVVVAIIFAIAQFMGGEMALRVIYAIFLGILLATFVGVGIAAFYPASESPQYPESLRYPESTPAIDGKTTQTPEQIQAQKDFDKQQADYEKNMKSYSRNVSTIAIAAAILILIISLTLARHILLIADGSLFGGILTLIYGIGWGFAAGDNKFRFMVVSIGLVAAVILGYLKFVKPEGKDVKKA